MPFLQEEGFGPGDRSDNPLLAKTGIKVGGKELVANDVFRAVHDYFGHVKDGVGFRADGEENAWRSHASMYTPLARRAMTTETRGQNSWVNYGPHGETNRTAKNDDTIYADQKAGLLPEEFSEDRYEKPRAPRGMSARAVQAINAPPANPASWSAPEASRMDNFIHAMQDKHVDTKRVVQAIVANTQAIHDSVDVYLQEELFHGRAAKQTSDFLDRELKPLIADMAARGVTIPDFEEYLHNRHAEERNVQIAKVNPKYPDGGSGIDTADARAYLSGLPSDKRMKYDALARRVDAMLAKTAALKVSGRLESQDTIDAWNGAYSAYVPLHREDMDAGGPGTGQGYSVKGKSKRATGSSKAVENILGHIALDRESTITRAEKNRIANALVALAAGNPNKDFWEVDKPPQRTYIAQNGLAVTTVDPTFKQHDNVVVARMLDANGDIVERAVIFNKHDERAIIAHPDQAFAWSISCYGTHMVRVGTPYECEGALRYDNVGVTFGRESNRAREMLRAVAEINEPHIELHMWDGRALVRCATQQDFVEQWERAVMRAALAELERRIPLYGEDIEGRIVAVRATLEARP